jgi:hypothetical protein
MSGVERQKILGAGVIGLALVFGAYTLSNFGRKTDLSATVANSEASTRAAIKTADKDNNGIEDWQDAYVQTKPIMLDKSATSSYTLPTTLTGQLGISFFESYISAQNAGPFGKNQQELVSDAASDFSKQTSDRLFDTKSISVMDEWNDADIRLYANTIAGIILTGKASASVNELYTLKEIVSSGDSSRIKNITTIAKDYEMFKNESLRVPVPAIFVKQHLDLINSYQAMQTDIEAMTLAFEDPLVTLLRLKRYGDDVLGLSLSLQNMNLSLQPYGRLFAKDDPAILFSSFDPNNQKQ